MDSWIVGLAILGSLAAAALIAKRRAAKGKKGIDYRHSRVDDEIDTLLERRMVDRRIR